MKSFSILNHPSARPYRRMILFFLRILGAVFVFYLAIHFIKSLPELDLLFKNSGFVFFLSKITAYATVGFLYLFGYQAQITYSYAYTDLINQGVFVINIPGSPGIWIGGHCLGLKLILLFIVLIVSFPGGFKRKILFIASGVFLIEIIYITRLAYLVVVSKRVSASGAHFDIHGFVSRVHDHLNIGIYFLIVVLFLTYALFFSKKST